MVMARVVVEDVLDLKVPICSSEEQQQIAADFDTAYEEAERLEQQVMPQLMDRLESAWDQGREKNQPPA
jgi:restriction endonuclease S subunit